MMLTTLQAGRAFAAIAVAVFHANIFFIPERLYPGVTISSLLNAGFAGVEYFFVLSGFIMLLVHERDIGIPARSLSFLRKRVTRIYPFYWLVLFGLIALYAVMPQLGDEAARNPLTIFSSVLLLPIGQPFIVVAAWTLSHEMLFYLLFSTLMLNRTLGIVVLSAWGVAILANAAFLHLPFPGSFLLSPYNLLFFFGIASAYLYRRMPNWAGASMAAVGLVGFPMMAILSVVAAFPFPEALRTVALGLTGAFLVCGLANLETTGIVKAPSPLVLLGDASYAIYLTHGIALAASAALLNRLGVPSVVPAPITFVAIVLVAVTGGLIAHLVLEKPLLSALRRGGERKSSAAVA